MNGLLLLKSGKLVWGNLSEYAPYNYIKTWEHKIPRELTIIDSLVEAYQLGADREAVLRFLTFHSINDTFKIWLEEKGFKVFNYKVFFTLEYKDMIISQGNNVSEAFLNFYDEL
jgi:hypothetical protein